ncbi:MAG TPA: hypothetical protein VGI39_38175 [Polyangiaceae bacterium]
MRWRSALAVLAPSFCAALAACGLDASGTGSGFEPGGDSGVSIQDAGGGADVTLMVDGGGNGGDASGGNDAGSVADSSPLPPFEAGPPSDAPVCSPTGTADCFTVPSGWALVAYAPAAGTACPSGFGQNPTDWVGGPQSNADECACSSCTVSDPPSCAGGPITAFFDFDGTKTCGLAAMPSQNSNNPAGACLKDVSNAAFPAGTDVRLIPTGPDGGECKAPGTPAKDKVTYAFTGRTCSPDSATAAGCSGTTCSPQLSSPFLACVAASGDVSCPGAPFTAKYVVGTDVSYDCGDCGCGVTATCTGTLTVYADPNCKDMNGLPLVVDGTCHNAGADGGKYASYQYVGNATNVGCTIGAPPPAPAPTLTQTTTICCP